MTNVWDQLIAKNDVLNHLIKFIDDNKETISLDDVYEHMKDMKRNYLQMAEMLKKQQGK